MDLDAFEKQVEKRLKKLDREQIVHFAWRCAVRALPFLGSKGNFDFWDEKDRQKHLYAVFYALDTNAANVAKEARAADVPKEARAASYAYDAYEEARAAAEAAARAATYARAASYDADAAASYDAASYDASARTAAYTRSASKAARAATYTADINRVNLTSIIWQDLGTFQRKGGNLWERVKSTLRPNPVTAQNEERLPVSTDVYDQIWNNFQKALAAEGCAYWGNLYQRIFDNDFILDRKALARRMNVPSEIRNQGAAAMARHLKAIETQGAERLNEARIIILGDKGAGKTCLARRLVDLDAPMTKVEESTAGVDTLLWKLTHKKKNERFNVRIWDFAGHVVTHAVHQFFLSERCLYIVVYDGRTEERNQLKYWLDHMQNYGGDSKAMILVNRRDEHPVDVPVNSLEEKYKVEADYTFSIKDDKTDLESFRKDVARYISNNASWNQQEIPRNYFQVKEELEQLFSQGENEKKKEHITKDEFQKIARQHDVADIESLLNDLHALGVSLWYKDMEAFNTLVLNPEWISHGVYQIINWVNKTKNHSLTLEDFVIVFKDNAARYPANQHGFLFNLMKHYELAYETDKEQCLIIPHLLKEDRPKELPVFPVGESLMLRYKAEQPLPPHTVSRFIVRHNQEIKKAKKESLVWRYGVVLRDGKGSIALVREEDRIISVSVKGRDKTDYISRLRETLNDIFNSYKSEKPELQYRVERYGQIPEEFEKQNPLWLSESKIVNHSNKKRPYFEDITGQDIDLHPTVNIYNISANVYTKNLMLGGQDNAWIEDHSITDDHSTHFNFHHCNIGLQGNLNELAQLLTEGGHQPEAKELENAAKALEEAEACQSPEEIQKKGITNRLKRLVKDLGDEKSTLHKSIKGIKHGISIAQDIAKGYNQIAQWVGLPQVPSPFLKK